MFPITEILIPAVRPVKKVEIYKPFVAEVLRMGHCTAGFDGVTAEDAIRHANIGTNPGDIVLGTIDLRTLPGAQPKARKMEAKWAWLIYGNTQIDQALRIVSVSGNEQDSQKYAITAAQDGFVNIRILHFVFADEAAE